MRVLIIRTSAMGDIVHCLPVLSALRRHLPSARIAWMVEEVFVPLLENHPDIDELIVVRLRQYRKHPFSRTVRRDLRAVRDACRRFAPDVALELMGNHKGALLARFSGARRILGPSRPYRREASSALWISEPVPTPGEHAVDRALDVLKPLFTNRHPADFAGGKILSETPSEAAAFLAAQDAPFFTIQAGAGWANKCYPPAWWGEVAYRLRDETGLSTWVPIAPGEATLAAEIANSSRGAARTVEATTFSFLAALLRQTVLLLGGDTGPLHLAHAFGTPVLCLMGPTDPRRNGPYGAPERVLWRRLPCSFCYKRFAEAKACLLEISPEKVVSKTRYLLGGS